MQSIIKV